MMGGLERRGVEPAEFAALLAQIPIFGGLPDDVLAKIVDATSMVEFDASAEVFREGEAAHSMYIVRDGELEVCKRGRNGAEFCLAILRRGDCVGEMSLIDIQPRSATVRAIGAVSLYVVDQRKIAGLYTTNLSAYTLLVINVAREISRRLRVADQVLVDMGIAVMGVDR